MRYKPCNTIKWPSSGRKISCFQQVGTGIAAKLDVFCFCPYLRRRMLAENQKAGVQLDQIQRIIPKQLSARPSRSSKAINPSQFVRN
jgi:hypothetical protein